MLHCLHTLTDRCACLEPLCVSDSVSLTRAAAGVTAELVAAVRALHAERHDVRLLVPVIMGLSKAEVLQALPELVALPPGMMRVRPSPSWSVPLLKSMLVAGGAAAAGGRAHGRGAESRGASGGAAPARAQRPQAAGHPAWYTCHFILARPGLCGCVCVWPQRCKCATSSRPSTRRRCVCGRPLGAAACVG
jgi:hypothetical protein